MLKPRIAPLTVIFGKIVLVLLGAGMALALMEALLRASPDLVAHLVRVNPPVRPVHAFRDEIYEVKLSDSDLYFWMKGAIRPLQPDQDKVVARVHFTTDANGFRNPLPEKSAYAIVTLGDSFTEASNVATPWPQELAKYTGQDTLNLGVSGIGSQLELEVLQEYGLKKHPQWVILAYFEGNDLKDAAVYNQARPFIILRLGKYFLTTSLAKWNGSRSDKSTTLTTPTDETSRSIDLTYQYPITIRINDTNLDMAFLKRYIAWLSVSREALESSQNYLWATESILQARELSESSGSHFLVVYIPSKPHVYLPYLLNNAELLPQVLAGLKLVDVDEAGFLEFTSQKVTPELIRQHMDDQAETLADFTTEQNIAFLDLTPHFQEEADLGTELYYPSDTHWNQQGHSLAAEVIARYISDGPTNKAR